MKKLLLGIVIIVILVGGIYISQKSPNNPSNKILSYSIPSDVASFDNAKLIESISINLLFGHVYESLINYDTDSASFKPLLAKSWDISNDGLVYKFNLREGVYFHDGTIFDSNVVLKNLNRIKNPKISPVLSQFLSGIKTIETPDKRTIKITLSSPDSSFLSKISFISIASAKSIKENTLSEKPTGTGPLVFTSHEIGKKIVFKRNDNYWGKKSNIAELDVLIIPDDLGRTLALKNGDIDFWIMSSFNPNVGKLVKQNNILFKSVAGNTINSIYFNLNDAQLSNRDIRVAFAESIDKKEILKILNNFGVKSKGPVPTMYKENTPEVTDYSFNLANAKSLYKKANIHEPIKILYISDDPVNKTISEYIASQWRKIGAEVEISGYDFAGILDKVVNRKFQAVLSYLGGPYPDPLFFIETPFSSSGPYSVFLGYNTKKIDQLVYDIKNTTDLQTRQKDFVKAQQIVIKDIPAIFLYDSKVGILYNKQKIKNIKIDSFISLKYLEQTELY